MEDIIKGNRIIAEFMGRYPHGADLSEYEEPVIIDIVCDKFSGAYRKCITRPFCYSDLKYSTSWDWIMPVVEKIEHSAVPTWVEIYGDRKVFTCTITDANQEYIDECH